MEVGKKPNRKAMLCSDLLSHGKERKNLFNEDMPKYIWMIPFWFLFLSKVAQGPCWLRLCLSCSRVHFYVCHMSRGVCAPGLKDWSKLCTEVLPIVPRPRYYAAATIPPSIWLTQSGRFLLPFMSCWKPPTLSLNFLSVQLSTSSKAETGTGWCGWGWGVWAKG